MRGLPSFPASDKRKDPRYKWFLANYGQECWELDAMDPNDLRDCVEAAIKELMMPSMSNPEPIPADEIPTMIYSPCCVLDFT